MGQSEKDDRVDNEHDSSDNKLIPNSTCTQRDVKAWKTEQWNKKQYHQFTGGMTGKDQKAAPHVNKGSIPYSVFKLYFAAVIALLVKTN